MGHPLQPYHSILLPVAAKAATVGEADWQKPCVAVPVGGGVVLMVTVTSSLAVLSPQVPID